MIPRLRARPPSTRTTRFDPRQRRLESLAGEFALLTQRRARTMHQLDLLDQQRAAAADTLRKVQVRLAWLLHNIDGADPGLREAAEPEMTQPIATHAGAALRDGRGHGAERGDPLPAARARPGWNAAHAAPAETPQRPAAGHAGKSASAAASASASGHAAKSGPMGGRGWAGAKWGPGTTRAGARHPGKWRN